MEIVTVNVSRRRLLALGSALLAGLAATLEAQRPAVAKAAKSDFLYQDHPHDGKRCAECKYFSAGGGTATGSCAVVEGTVSANGWCQAFLAKP